jgi:hypothetical protein
MLDFLITSKARRRLLSLLWREKKSGAVSELAELADVAFASAHAELKEMQRLQLVTSALAHGKEVFAANFAHPHAKTFVDLVALETPESPNSSADDLLLKRKLAALGAPLRGVERLNVPTADVANVLVEAVRLARRDPVIARTLPVSLWKHRDQFDARILGGVTGRPEDKHALGFFLELTGELGGDRRLVGIAETLRDRRMTSLRPFFQIPGRQVTRDFALATRWGFTMNMDFETFKSLFAKFVD